MIECDGGPYCAAVRHVHGCFADKGNCDHPSEHVQMAGEAQTDATHEPASVSAPLAGTGEQPSPAMTGEA